MSKRLKVFLCIGLIFISVRLNAANIFSAQSGLWSNTTTWVGGVVPGSADFAIVDNGHQVTLDGNYTITNLGLVNDIAGKILYGGNIFVASVSLTITDYITGLTPAYGFAELTAQAIELNNDLGITMTGTGDVIRTWGYISAFRNLTINNVGVASLATGITIDGGTLTITSGSTFSLAAFDIRQSSLSTISVSGSLSLDGAGAINGGAASSNFGTVTCTGTGIVNIGTSAYVNTDNLNLNSGSLWNVSNDQPDGWWHSTATGPVGGTIDANSTVDFNRSGNQGIGARTYGNLNITSGGTSATKTLSASGTLTVQGNLYIGGSTTFSSNNSNTITVQGTTTNDGIWTVTQPILFNGGGTQVINGLLGTTFNGTVTFDNAMNIDTDVIFGSTVSCGSNAMSFAGGFTNNGTYNCSGTTIFDGVVAQSIGGSSVSTFSNLTVSNTSSTATINGGGSRVTGTLTLSANSGFNANGLLTIVSDAAGTARIAAIPSSATFNGNVIYQRYITGGQQTHGIGFPISGTTAIFTNSSYPDPDLSIQGDFSRYNESIAGDLNQGYETSKNVPFSNIDDNRGYFFWTRTANDPGTLEITGPINAGNISIPVSYTVQNGTLDDGWNLVNNPYASQIDGNINNWTNTGLDGVSYVWDPSGAGAYITNPTTIASGQSFWVHANAASPTLVATQAIKTSSAATFYRIAAPEIINELSIALVDGETSDLAKIIFKDDADEEFDTQYDGYKLQNGIFNLSSLTEAGLDLSINNIPMVGCSRIVKLNITNINEGGYQLKFDGLVTFDMGYEFVLKDNFLGTNTIVEEGMLHDFSVTADAASWGNSRFEIVLSAADLDAVVAYEVTDECNFASSVSITNAQVGVSYSLVQNGNYLTTQIATSSTLLLPLTEEQVRAGLNQYDLEITNGSCGNVTKPNAIEFTINPIDVGTIQYESNVECDLITNVTINNAQLGVTYTLIQNGDAILANEAITNQVVFNLSQSQVSEGLNQFDLDLSNGSCPNALAQNAIEFTIDPKQEISLVVDNESCGAGQVLLKAEGATGNAYYAWYESPEIGAVPIVSEISNEFLSPVLESSKDYYVAIINEAGCESVERRKVSAIIKTLPAIDFILQATDLCDLTNNLRITNAIIGATYRLVDESGTVVSMDTASETSLTLPLTEQSVSEDANVFDMLIEMNGCTSEVLDAITFNYYSLSVISVNNYVDGCENSNVTLVADGAKANEHYNWYESDSAVEPIPNEVGPEYIITAELAIDRSYFVSIVNENGCETNREQIEVTIIYIDTPIITKDESNGILSTIENEDFNYKWYKDGDEIPGETKSSLVLVETGNYEVGVSVSGCSKKSEPKKVDSVLGLKELNDLGISIYPNPVVDILSINNNNRINSIIIYDTKGVAVYRSGKSIPSEINLTSIRKGIYIISIATDNKTINYRVRKK